MIIYVFFNEAASKKNYKRVEMTPQSDVLVNHRICQTSMQ